MAEEEYTNKQGQAEDIAFAIRSKKSKKSVVRKPWFWNPPRPLRSELHTGDQKGPDWFLIIQTVLLPCSENNSQGLFVCREDEGETWKKFESN